MAYPSNSDISTRVAYLRFQLFCAHTLQSHAYQKDDWTNFNESFDPLVSKNLLFFLSFSCLFLNHNIFFAIWILIDLINLQEQVKKHSVYTKNCSDLSLFEQIVLVVISNCIFSVFNLEFQKKFSITTTIFLTTVGQNNFGNKIQISLY